MLGADGASALVGLPKDVVDFAERLGALLSSQLHKTLNVAFALEAKKMRCDMRCALKEFRNDFRLPESDCVVESTDDHAESSRHASHLSPPTAMVFGASCPSALSFEMSSAITCGSADSRHSQCRTPVAAQRVRRRVPSGKIEKQLKDKVVAVKLATTAVNSERQGSQSPASQWRQQVSFQQVVPADIESQMSKSNSLSTSRSLLTLGNEPLVKMETLNHVSSPAGDPSSSSNAEVLRSTSSTNTNALQSRVIVEGGSEDVAVPNRQSTSTFMDSVRSMGNSSRIHHLSSISSNVTVDRWKNAATKFYDRKHDLIVESWGPARRINLTLSRALGLLPWNNKFVWLSKVYQLFFFVALVLSTLSVVTRLSPYSTEKNAKDFTDLIDNILVFGSLLSFIASFLKNRAYVESQYLVESYLSRAGFLDELNFRSCIENVAILLLWLACVVLRFYAHAFELHLYEICFAFNVLALLGTCAYVLRLCRGLHFIVDSFCQYMTEKDFDFEDAMQEWFLLHCTIHTACASLQICFVALQLTAIGIVLFGASSIYLGMGAIDQATVVTLIPGALCIIVLLYLSMRAAFVSDVCRRVPMLVNSSKAEFDLKRMYLVEYIVHCETGFYIFEARLSSAMLFKSFYIACAATLGLLTQIWRRLN